MEKPTLETSEVTNGYERKEAMDERLEVLASVIQRFRSNVKPVITEWKNISSIEFKKEKGYDDELKRNIFTKILSVLTEFETEIRAAYKLFEISGGGDGLNHILAQVREVKERLSAAPDVRYSKEAQIETFGGKENIPGNKCMDTYEDTRESVNKLQSEIDGIYAALIFVDPKNYKVV